MSFDQLPSIHDKPVADADVLRARSLLRPMSRRHIMGLSIKVAEIAGLASHGLFDTVSVYATMPDTCQTLFAVYPVGYCATFGPDATWFDGADHLTLALPYREAQEKRAIRSTHLGDIQKLGAEGGWEQVGSIVAIPEGVGR